LDRSRLVGIGRVGGDAVAQHLIGGLRARRGNRRKLRRHGAHAAGGGESKQAQIHNRTSGFHTRTKNMINQL